MATELSFTLIYDIILLMLFTKYPNLLKHLIAAIRRVDTNELGEVIIKNPDFYPTISGQAFYRYDLHYEIGDIESILEIQTRDTLYLKDRTFVLYLRLITDASVVEDGDPYGPDRIMYINILNVNLFPEEKNYYSKHAWMNITRNEVWPIDHGIYFIELNKKIDKSTGENPLELWIDLFKAKTDEDLDKILESGDEVMTQVVKAIGEIAKTDKFKEEERLRRKALSDETGSLNAAEKKGLIEGTQIGEKKKSIEIAAKLLKGGKLSHPEILEATDLTEEELQKILEESGKKK
jgi:predicted transposase/invertase (TIGR01784 family)